MIVRGYSTSGEVPPSGEVEEDLAWDGEEEEEDVILAENEDDEQREMDNVVGVLQGLLMDEGFVAMQDHFFAQHAGSFADELEGGSGENKLCYMHIFQLYVQHTESYMEGYLQQHLKQDWSVGEVAAAVLKTQEEEGVEGDEVLEVLLSLTDFTAFKEAMVAYLRGQAASATTEGGHKGTAHKCNTYHESKLESGEGKEDQSRPSETRDNTSRHDEEKPYAYTHLHYTHT